MEARIEQRVRRPCTLAAALARAGTASAARPRELSVALVESALEDRDTCMKLFGVGEDEALALAALELAVRADGRDATLLAVWIG